TPALDALFADSVVFDSARSSAPWTKPSMASILTGLSPLVHGTTSEGVRLPKEVHTFAEHMAGAGYVTAAMGSNVHLEPRFGFAQGFDQYWLPVRKEWGDSLGSSLLERADPKRFPALFPSTEALADVAVEWLTENRDREFFLWIHVLDPHWPYAPPAEHLPERKEGERIGDHWGEHDTVRSVQAGTGRLSAADQERVRGLYRGEIEYVDAQLGRVFETLRELELYDDALIAFTSDHGEEFWEHGTFEHGHTLFDEVLRVPLAFKLPGNSTRAHVDADVPNEALLPTVLEVLGIEPAHEMSSASLVEMWSGGDASARDGFAAGTYYYNEKRMLLTGGMKLIVDYATDRVELYNLADDPDERFPLVGETGAKVEAILEQMKAREALQLQLRESLGIKNAAVQSDSAARRSMRNIGYSGDE
ncbi:MAG: choline-sulfatase, partial [Planctomycetota bacterium]